MIVLLNLSAIDTQRISRLVPIGALVVVPGKIHIFGTLVVIIGVDLRPGLTPEITARFVSMDGLRDDPAIK